MNLTSAIQIYSSGDHYHSVHDSLPDMKALAKATTATELRRIGRFIQLAVIGAARCTQSAPPPRNTGVYFASARGDLDLTVEIMTQLYRNGQVPKPLSFVNAVSNAPCFYLAQLLRLNSRSNFVCNHYFAFESALRLALLDVTLQKVDSALVGSLDIASSPLDEHRQRLQLPADTAIGEGSHWLWLGKPDSNKPRIGEVLAAQHFIDCDMLVAWSDAHSFYQLALSRGQFVSDAMWAQITAHIKHESVFDYRSNRSYYDSQSGAVIGEFLRSHSPASTLLHINADDDGRCSVMVAKK